MHKVKKTSRDRKPNKENMGDSNAQGEQKHKKVLERGAKDHLYELSDITSQHVTLNTKKTGLTDLTPWNEIDEEELKIRP